MGQDGRKPATRRLVICHWSSEGHQRPGLREESGKAINLSGHRCSHSTSALCRLQWCGFCGNINSATWSCCPWQDLIFPKMYSTVAQQALLDTERCRAILLQYYIFWSKEEQLLIQEQLQDLLWVDPINGSVKGRSLTVAKTLCNP